MLSPARTGAAVLTAALLAGLAAAPALADSAASPSPSPVAAPAALYGRSDPTYDGVWRQSLALTALAGARIVPADSAVTWLTGQQCADGGWPSFRADTAAACTAAAEDSNATSVAIQALTALGGHQDAVARGVQWIKANQNADGSWSYNPGTPGDANSTGLVVSALRAAKADPSTVAKAGKNGLDGLAAFQLGCAAPADQRGAFAYQPDAKGALAANALATSQATLAAAGGSLPVAAGAPSGPAPTAPACADATAQADPGRAGRVRLGLPGHATRRRRQPLDAGDARCHADPRLQRHRLGRAQPGPRRAPAAGGRRGRLAGRHGGALGQGPGRHRRLGHRHPAAGRPGHRPHPHAFGGDRPGRRSSSRPAAPTPKALGGRQAGRAAARRSGSAVGSG